MNIEVSVPYQFSIKYENEQFKVVGSQLLFDLLKTKVKLEGKDILKWTNFSSVDSSEKMLINELIEKAQKKDFIYKHEELCHCRLVSTEKVRHAVKLGCHQVQDISRVTLAGTGCGSCRADIAKVIAAICSEAV